jgi:Fe-S cluster biogenesis protein NfuA
MFIQTETTTNPARIKFLPDETVLTAGTAGFLDRAGAAQSPLAQRLFAIEGVASVYLDPFAITLTKTDEAEWPMLKPAVFGAIMEHYAAGEPIIRDDGRPLPRPGLDTSEGQAIQNLLDTRINPPVASHGGRISLVDVRDDTAYIRLEGGCQGCGMADVTLKQGVATEIQALVPTIENVLDVTDLGGGENPYFEQGKGAGGASPFYQPGK